MKKYVFAIICAVFTLPVFCQTGEKNFIDQNYIEVSGTAEMEVSPDLISLQIFISETDTKGKTTAETLEKEMKEQLVKVGIDLLKDLKVSNLSSHYQSRFLGGNSVAVSRSYVLVTHDAATAEKVVELLGEIGISNISVLKIDHSQLAQKRFNLRLDAVKAAKVKAEAMAAALGQSIGKAIFVSENFDSAYLQTISNSVNGVFGKNRLDLMESTSMEPELEFQQIPLRSSVLVRFILN
jgi:uncharacterized protein YggE